MIARVLLPQSAALVFGFGFLLNACKGSPGDPNMPPVQPMSAMGADCESDGMSVTIHDNHGHRMSVSIQDIMTGTTRTYDIQGTALHSHIVTLTSDDFLRLRENIGVAENSSVDVSHFHAIDVVCI